MSQETFARVVGSASFHLWPGLPRDTQEKLFEVAVGTDDALRHPVFLHEHHPCTAHPPKP